MPDVEECVSMSQNRFSNECDGELRDKLLHEGHKSGAEGDPAQDAISPLARSPVGAEHDGIEPGTGNRVHW